MFAGCTGFAKQLLEQQSLCNQSCVFSYFPMNAKKKYVPQTEINAAVAINILIVHVFASIQDLMSMTSSTTVLPTQFA